MLHHEGGSLPFSMFACLYTSASVFQSLIHDVGIVMTILDESIVFKNRKPNRIFLLISLDVCSVILFYNTECYQIDSAKVFYHVITK